MKAESLERPKESTSFDKHAMSATHRKTLEAIFRHPSAHNLEWHAVVALIEKIGEVTHKPSDQWTFRVSGEFHRMPKPQTKDLSGSDVIQLRDFLARAGWSAESAPRAAMGPADKTLAVSPTLMVAMDHHEARIFHILDAPDGETGEVIKPYDPHHFRHHLTHRGQTQEQGQRAPEDFSFYEQITQTLKSAEKIILIGHGTGKSNAAHHLVEYLRTHAPETYQHVIGEAVADLSSITTPQFFELGQQALRQ